MPDRPLLYYITDRAQLAGDEGQRRQKLRAKISEAAACGIDFIQLREKDLSSRELEVLALQAQQAIREAGKQQAATRLLINSRSDVALAVGANGVHLRSHDISIPDARKAATIASGNLKLETRNWIVAVSCHSEEEVRVAATEGANFVVFAPVFQKKDGSRPADLEALRRASRHSVPVLALGGVTVENAKSCLDAGAAGIAGIRVFQQNAIAEVVRKVRG